MTKYLVDVYLPAIGKHYDAYLPGCKYIGEVILLLVNIMESLSNGSFKGSAESVLINADNGQLLDCNATVFDAGIRNSSKLILI